MLRSRFPWLRLGVMLRRVPADRAKGIFTLVWVAPGALFLHLHVSQVRQQRISPVCCWLRACLWLGSGRLTWYGLRAAGPPAAKWGLLAVGVVVNDCDLSSHPRSTALTGRCGDSKLNSKAFRGASSGCGSAEDTLIVGFDSHFLGYRHAGYYLPGYFTMEYPEVKLREGTGSSPCTSVKPACSPALPAGGPSKFVLFPLPGVGSSRGTAISANRDEQAPQPRPAHSPPGWRRLCHRSDLRFAPCSSPNRRAPKPGVYALLHSVS